MGSRHCGPTWDGRRLQEFFPLFFLFKGSALCHWLLVYGNSFFFFCWSEVISWRETLFACKVAGAVVAWAMLSLLSLLFSMLVVVAIVDYHDDDEMMMMIG